MRAEEWKERAFKLSTIKMEADIVLTLPELTNYANELYRRVDEGAGRYVLSYRMGNTNIYGPYEGKNQRGAVIEMWVVMMMTLEERADVLQAEIAMKDQALSTEKAQHTKMRMILHSSEREEEIGQ